MYYLALFAELKNQIGLEGLSCEISLLWAFALASLRGLGCGKFPISVWLGALHHVAVKTRELTRKQILSVPCPTGGAATEEACELHTGALRCRAWCLLNIFSTVKGKQDDRNGRHHASKHRGLCQHR
jgi:hypothetical protein